MSLTGWTETTVGQTAEFLTGFPFASSGFTETGIRLIRGSNVKRGVIAWSSDIARYWPHHDSSLRAFVLRDGDIVIAMDGALVGRSFARITEVELPAYLVQRVARLRGKAIDQDLLYQWIGSQDFVRHVDDVKTHTAIPHISPRDIRDFKISIPADLNEQRAVSAALRDADDLIATLERLIAKKQAIKQGMMQQLLTGRTRLPGFSGHWQTTSLGKLGLFLKGRGVKRDDVISTGVPCIRYGELYTAFRDYTATTRSFVSQNVATSALPIRTGDLLFAGSGETRDEIGICVAYIGDAAAVAGGDIVVLRGEDFNPIFLATLTNMPVVANQKARAGQGDAVVHISSRALSEITLTIPCKPEQDAIASVILDADAEIDLLCARLGKARDTKTGMMQQLLTGRVRLPVEASA